MDFNNLQHVPESQVDEVIVELILAPINESPTPWLSAGAYGLFELPPSHKAVEVTDDVPAAVAVSHEPLAPPLAARLG